MDNRRAHVSNLGEAMKRLAVTREFMKQTNTGTEEHRKAIQSVIDDLKADWEFAIGPKLDPADIAELKRIVEKGRSNLTQ